MSYGGVSSGVRPFFIVAPIVLGACLIMLFSEDERGHLGKRIQLQTIFTGMRQSVILIQENMSVDSKMEKSNF